MNQQAQTLLHLTLLKGIGPVTVCHLYTQLPSFLQIYEMSVSDLVQAGVLQSKAQVIVQGLQDQEIIQKELELAYKHGVHIVTLADEQYPEIVRSIDSPPPVLWWKGTRLDGFEQSLAVVGARNAHAYAHRSIETIVGPLAAQGWAVVSGGAVGADTYAHQIALDAGGVTYSVLGSGLLKPYPSINMGLFDQIVHSGALISAFPLQTEPLQGNFPARNRIIAGLARGCLVVQAAQQSGALITAKYALEYAREVFAVPGLITDQLQVGCHSLIRQGAHITTSDQDILEVFGFARKVAAMKTAEALHPLLVHAQKQVSVQELADVTGWSLETVQTELFTLLIEGKIEQTATGGWQRI
jgi:DNA processing protein